MTGYYWSFAASLCAERLFDRDHRHLATVFPNGDWYLYGYGETGPWVMAHGSSPTRSYREGKQIVEQKCGIGG